MMKDPDWNQMGRRWWSHVSFLASDENQGRETGSPGYARAAEYVAQQFRDAGLEPAGVDGYLQPMDFQVAQLDAAHSSLELLQNGTVHPVPMGDAASFVVSSKTAERVEADAVFVGYGLTVPELGYDDLAGLDLQGKVAVILRGGPADMPGPLKAHFQSPEERVRSLRNAGAIGFIGIVNPKIPELPWPRMAIGLLMPRMELRDVGPDGYQPLPLSILFNPEQADPLFVGSGHKLKDLVDRLGTDGPLPRFPLAVKIRARVAVSRRSARCHNIVGLLPGTDTELKSQHIVVSAHLDHLGVGTPVNGDPIYHGAMDNASGVASIIESPPPKVPCIPRRHRRGKVPLGF
jgi:hypothetical protein